MKTKHIVVNYPQCNESCGYKVTLGRDRITLCPENNCLDNSWTEKGLNDKFVLQANDNDILIKLNNKKILLDYSEAEKVQILLNLYTQMDKQTRHFEIKEVVIRDIEYE